MTDDKKDEFKKATGGIAQLFDKDGNHAPFLQLLLNKLEEEYLEVNDLKKAINNINKSKVGSHYITLPLVDRVLSVTNEDSREDFEKVVYGGMVIQTNRPILVITGDNTVDAYTITLESKPEDLEDGVSGLIRNVSVVDMDYLRDAEMIYAVELIHHLDPHIIVDKEKGRSKIFTPKSTTIKRSYERETSFAWSEET